MSRQNEIEAFTREYLAYRPILSRTVMKILRCRRETEDVLQDVWIKGALTVARGGIEHCKSWLWRTATNVAYDRLRYARRHPAALVRKDVDAAPREIADHRPGPFERLAQAHASRRMTQAVTGLPTNQQEVLLARVVDDEPFKEIAERSGAPIVTVRSRMFRALGTLRVTLADEKKAA